MCTNANVFPKWHGGALIGACALIRTNTVDFFPATSLADILTMEKSPGQYYFLFVILFFIC